MTPEFEKLFPSPRTKPVLGVIHLLPLPGAPGYDGNLSAVYDRAITEASIFADSGLEGVIIENFGDAPFYPSKVPNETVATMAAIAREVQNVLRGRTTLGINVLRNDASAAVAIAAAVEASFIRVNVHLGATVTDQGIIETRAWETLRLIRNLQADIEVFADVQVKHAAPLTNLSLENEARDLAERGGVSGLILSGSGTGHPTDEGDLIKVKECVDLPLMIGSGVNHENISKYFSLADAFIVGTCFKKVGSPLKEVDPDRVNQFMQLMQQASK